MEKSNSTSSIKTRAEIERRIDEIKNRMRLRETADVKTLEAMQAAYRLEQAKQQQPK